MEFANSPIHIKWQEEPRNRSSLRTFIWKSNDIVVTTDDDEDVQKIDLLLGAPGALSCLKTAFSKQRTRKDLWRFERLTREQDKALHACAQVFKRGVVVDSQRDDTTAKENLKSGTSTICFSEKKNYPYGFSAQVNDWIVVDANVAKHCKKFLPTNITVVSCDEAHKNLKTAADIFLQIPATASRVVIIGGGVLGDVAGFAAAQLGLSTVYIPTTLLAMADSSIGGKTGVNMPPYGKNQVGRFHPPELVVVSPLWFASLPEREFRAGLVECLKHALLSGDDQLWQLLIEASCSRDTAKVYSHLKAIIQVKANIVGRDPFEQGERAVLNLGHTLGHALEALSQKYDLDSAINHGEAVAIGLAYAVFLSQKLYGFKSSVDYIKDLQTAGFVNREILSSRVQTHFSEIPALLSGDKKNDDAHTVRWVLLKAPGEIARDPDGGWTIPLKDGFDPLFLAEVLGDPSLRYG